MTREEQLAQAKDDVKGVADLLRLVLMTIPTPNPQITSAALVLVASEVLGWSPMDNNTFTNTLIQLQASLGEWATILRDKETRVPDRMVPGPQRTDN